MANAGNRSDVAAITLLGVVVTVDMYLCISVSTYLLALPLSAQRRVHTWGKQKHLNSE